LPKRGLVGEKEIKTLDYRIFGKVYLHATVHPHWHQGCVIKATKKIGHFTFSVPEAWIPTSPVPGRLLENEENAVEAVDLQVVAQKLSVLIRSCVRRHKECKQRKLTMQGLRIEKSSEAIRIYDLIIRATVA